MRRSHKELEELLLNNKFNRLLVLGARKSTHHWMWKVRCDCGKEFETRSSPLFSGRTKSCGCLNRERSTKHGMYNSKEYHTWRCMINRCTNPGNKDFMNYGARGISVCDRWKNSFENFFKDMGKRPRGKTLDRIDTDGNYGVGNCKWSSSKDQARNRRNVIRINIDGINETVTERCKRLGSCTKSINARVKKGMTYEEAFKDLIKSKHKKNSDKTA